MCRSYVVRLAAAVVGRYTGIEWVVMRAWHRSHLVDAAAMGLALVPVGGELDDQGLVDLMAVGVEGLLRSEICHQFAGWPPESTTDGSVPYVCWRSGDDVLQLVGLTHMDFGESVFPFRTDFRVDNQTGHTTVTIFVGQVDDETGDPRRLRPGSIVIAVRSGGQVISAELIAERRQAPIVWTKAILWDGAAQEA